jgi:tetratricopeptide (TPR) repeat protein
MTRNYYVYFHKDSGGNIFYVGKGTGKRAWSLDRDQVWTKYVNDRLCGKFSVEIHKDDLTEDEALHLENGLINEYGSNLVNWVNMQRQTDFDLLNSYHVLREQNLRFVGKTYLIEKTVPTQAIIRYKQAISAIDEYESIKYEKGLIGELYERPKKGEPEILDRLSICLLRLGRVDEAVEEARLYFEKFPDAVSMSIGKRILSRIEKAKQKQISRTM